MMLEHLGYNNEASEVRNAINRVLTNKEKTTKDIGGKATTKEYIDEIIKNI